MRRLTPLPGFQRPIRGPRCIVDTRGGTLARALCALLLSLPPLGIHRGSVTRTARSVNVAAHDSPFSVMVARARSEPALTIDPRNGERLVGAANPDYFHILPDEPLNGTLLSLNGGLTWAHGSAPTYGSFTGVADPSLGADAIDHIYYLYMGETPSYCGASGNVALLLSRSDNGGRSFAAPTVVDVNPLDDKPFIAVASAAGHTIVYVTFTRWYDRDRRILFTRSLDSGRTFAPPTAIFASSGINFGAIPVAGNNGQIDVIWAHYQASNYGGPLRASIMVRASRDGGRTFAPARTISSFTGLPEMLEPGSLRLFTLPTAVVDARNYLYVAWVRARAMARPRFRGEMEADVMLSRSRDNGRTWTEPIALNDTPRGDRFMPVLSIGASGTPRVAFYDRRADYVHFALYGVAARDLGDRLQIWPNRKISAALSSPYTLHYIVPGSTCVAPGRFMGDYIAAATSPDGALNVLWTNTAPGRFEETDLWFARVPAVYLQAGTPRVVRLSRLYSTLCACDASCPVRTWSLWLRWGRRCP